MNFPDFFWNFLWKRSILKISTKSWQKQYTYNETFKGIVSKINLPVFLKSIWKLRKQNYIPIGGVRWKSSPITAVMEIVNKIHSSIFSLLFSMTKMVELFAVLFQTSPHLERNYYLVITSFRKSRSLRFEFHIAC